MSTTQQRRIQKTLSRTELQHCHDFFKHLFRSNFFKCLNDETRQEIILLVGQVGEEGMPVADIAERFNSDRTTISHHLALLRDNRLLISTKRGRERYYSLNVEYVVGALEEMVSILKSCCGNRDGA